MNSETKERVILVVCGVVAAAVAIMLASSGNPGNMAICIACFVRDTAGAMKLQTNQTVQYLRPEIIANHRCALALWLLQTRNSRPQAGSSPFTRFVLGFVMMIGCLIFLGCPLRMVLRMAGGDLNAWVALIGFAAGIGVGVLFLKKGFSLGRAEAVKKAEGLALPVIVIAVFVLSITTTVFAVSQSGPGSMHAPVALSIIGGIAFGVIAQRTRLCFAGGLRDTFLVRDGWGLVVIGILFAGVLVYNLASGHFNLSFADQPIAHTDALWNILGMFVVGFSATLLGGCPLRQMVLAGSGSGDSAVTFIGLLVGAAFAHNFGIASSPKGVTEAGQIATVVCIVVLFVIAAVNLKRARS